MSTITVLVPIANASEEIEAVCIIDTLVRAGAKVVVASAESQLQVTCSRGVKLVADRLLSDISESEHFDLVAVPGGMPGAKTLGDNVHLQQILRRQVSHNLLVGAICAAPAVALAGVLDGRRATCYPAEAHRTKLANVASVSDDRVVVDGKFVTSQGPGTSLEFALELVNQLFGAAKRDEIQKQLLVVNV